MARIYVETFDDGPGGWLGWISNAAGAKRLEVRDSCLIDRSPWWVDYNHAPPGGGYLHLPFALQTRPHWKNAADHDRLAGVNRFIEGGFPTDFRDAKVTLKLRGDLDLRGARLVFHAQSKVGNVFVNQCLTGQPFEVTRETTEQTVTLTRDPKQWTQLGSRHDRTDFYGKGDIEDVLRDLNGNIILILFPLDVVPLDPAITGEQMHRLRAGEDYEVERRRLPEGALLLGEVRIEFAR